MRHIPVQVTPEAAENKVIEKDDGRLEVAVTAEAEGGAANKAVCALVRRHLNAAGGVRIVAGHQSRAKILAVDES